MQITLPLFSPDLTLANAGGKGANLSALIRGDFAVPGGFVVTTAGYDAFVAANGLAAPIAARVEAIDATDPTAYDRASAQIRRCGSRTPWRRSAASIRTCCNLTKQRYWANCRPVCARWKEAARQSGPGAENYWHGWRMQPTVEGEAR